MTMAELTDVDREMADRIRGAVDELNAAIQVGWCAGLLVSLDVDQFRTDAKPFGFPYVRGVVSRPL